MKDIDSKECENAAQSLAKELHEHAGGNRRVVLILQGDDSESKMIWHPGDVQPGPDIYVELNPETLDADANKGKIFRGNGFLAFARKLREEQCGLRDTIEKEELEQLVVLLENERLLRRAQQDAAGTPATNLMKEFVLWCRLIDDTLQGYSKHLNQFAYSLQSKAEFALTKQVSVALELVPPNLADSSDGELISLAQKILECLSVKDEPAKSDAPAYVYQKAGRDPKKLVTLQNCNPDEIPFHLLFDEHRRLSKFLSEVSCVEKTEDNNSIVRRPDIHRSLEQTLDSLEEEMKKAVKMEPDRDGKSVAFAKKLAVDKIEHVINELAATALRYCQCDQTVSIARKHHKIDCVNRLISGSREEEKCKCPYEMPAAYGKNGHNCNCPNYKDPFGCHDSVLQHAVISQSKLLKYIVTSPQPSPPADPDMEAAVVYVMERLQYDSRGHHILESVCQGKNKAWIQRLNQRLKGESQKMWEELSTLRKSPQVSEEAAGSLQSKVVSLSFLLSWVGFNNKYRIS